MVSVDYKATMEESVDKNEKVVIPVSDSLEMVIRNDFAKYMIDQRASLVPSNSILDKTGYIFAPALPTVISELKASLENRVLIRADLGNTDTDHKSITRPFVMFEVVINRENQSKLHFTILFEESLLKFLPQDPTCYSTLYASFASTSMDKFLFIQFAAINLQIRTLLLTRDQDLRRIFREKSFFAVSRSKPTDWVDKYKFEINKVVRIKLQQCTTSDSFIITIRDVSRNIFFEKEEYKEYLLDVEEHSGSTSYFLYSHVTNVGEILKVFGSSRDSVIECLQTDSGLILDYSGEKIIVGEVLKIQEIPIIILRSDNFVIRKDVHASFVNKEFFVTRMSDDTPVPSVHKNNSVAGAQVHCPFPSCVFQLVNNLDTENYDLILDHFLASHKDFSKVITNQLRRHQGKKSTNTNSCPFDQCEFTSDSSSNLEKHYGSVHKIGLIVFLQFSVANKWNIERFKEVGCISPFISSLVQCSHCFEVMTRQQLASHVASLR